MDNVRDLLGGSLRPSDPRRFLIEAMIGAMNADGVIDPRELQVVEQHIASHELLAGLAPAQARTLTELANDAVRIAGAPARTAAIARGLPARIHRLAAYGMAAEVAAADAHVVARELDFLEQLRLALRIGPYEANQLMAAAQQGWLARYLDDRFLRIRGLISIACQLFALRAHARGHATDEHRFAVRDFFLAIPDLVRPTDELDVELYRAFRRPREPGAQVFGSLRELAQGLPDPVDRYWLVVYALVAEVQASAASWRLIPFVGVMQAAFQIGDTDMELAVADALAFPATLPRPG
ncbi:MAG: TerB family tellurite resistance protein [Kofleriaceae bacterium]|jgi:uncharacterized tellurite resistance protein B-like protein|nr:TerB family tellurite resistance protein [Kofleriaceae bacterium]MBP9207049.1 TerB family tellurite resistance protein [Kofleriaceae bacterium]